GNRRAPVVPDDDRRLRAQSVEGADHVAHEVEQRVPANLLRSVRRAVAPHVRGYRVKAGGRERGKLVPPRIPGFGKSVTEDDEGARALLGEMHADAVRLDRPMLDHLAVEPGGHQPAP